MGSKSSKEITAYVIVKEYLTEQLGEPQCGQNKRGYTWKLQCRMSIVNISIATFIGGSTRERHRTITIHSAGSQSFTIENDHVIWDFLAVPGGRDVDGDKLFLADPNFFYKLSYDIARAMACASAGMYTHSCIGWMAKNEIEPHLSEYVKKWKNQ